MHLTSPQYVHFNRLVRDRGVLCSLVDNQCCLFKHKHKILRLIAFYALPRTVDCISLKMSEELRIITYMCPTHPVELYQLIMELLEEALGWHTTLQYESRTPGPFKDRPDPFVTNKVDLGEYLLLFFNLKHLTKITIPKSIRPQKVY